MPLILRCGLPFVVTVLPPRTASALTKGLVAGIVVALVGTVVTLLVRPRMRTIAAYCVAPRVPGQSPESRG